MCHLITRLFEVGSDVCSLQLMSASVVLAEIVIVGEMGPLLNVPDSKHCNKYALISNIIGLTECLQNHHDDIQCNDGCRWLFARALEIIRRLVQECIFTYLIIGKVKL